MEVKDLLQKFWVDFYIPTQDEDSSFPYANPSDASRSLIKARNWTGTLTEKLVEISFSLAGRKRDLRAFQEQYFSVERVILAREEKIFAYITKSKELLKAFIWSKADRDEITMITVLEEDISKLIYDIHVLDSEKEIIQEVLKKLDKTTDWLVQYINWMKIEARLGNG